MLGKVQSLQSELSQTNLKMQQKGGEVKQSQQSLESQIYMLKTKNQELESAMLTQGQELKEMREVTLQGQVLEIGQKKHQIKELQDKLQEAVNGVQKEKTKFLLKESEIVGLKDKIASGESQVKNQTESYEQDKRAAAKRLQERERKIAQLDQKISDLEEEKLIVQEEQNEKLASQKAIADY